MTMQNFGPLLARPWRLAWSADAPVAVHQSINRSLIGHLPHLVSAERRNCWRPRPFALSPIQAILGDVRQPSHFLSVEGLDWGFRLTEDQCTRALVYFLSANGDESLRRKRCGLFVRALYAAAAIPEPKLDPGNAIIGTLNIDAEYPVGRRRVDIALHWDESTADGGLERRVLLIECKFNHRITPGQLGCYSGYAQSRVDAQYAVFLLHDRISSVSQEELNKNPEWQPVSWRSVLRRLMLEMEHEAWSEQDNQFLQLLRTIWDMGHQDTF